MARRGRQVSPDEAQLFHALLKDAKPLKGRARKVAPESPPPPPRRLSPDADSAPKPNSAGEAGGGEGRRADFAGGGAIKIVPPLPPLGHGKAAGIDKRTHERFRKGEMAIDARLDLHGMTQDVAHAALTRFVARAAAAEQRVLLVVTGKGGREGTGVLRAEVPRWLNESALRPLILAIHRARPQHGGDGALYVLLKRRR